MAQKISQIAEFETITAIKDAIVKAIHPEQVWLFGSFAKGTQNDDSDYDFYVVISDDEAHKISDLSGMAYCSCSHIYNRNKDILLSRKSTFNKNKYSDRRIEGAIIRTGICIYG